MSGGMVYTRLGRTGLTVSRLCLGCMTYGVPERGAHPWTLPEGWQPEAAGHGPHRPLPDPPLGR